MIATNEEFSQAAGAGNDLVRVGPIAHNVAKVDHKVIGRGSRQAGFQSFEIAVNIANDENAHESPDRLAIIDPRLAGMNF